MATTHPRQQNLHAVEIRPIHIFYSYRFIFAPETIGAITYISKNITKLKKNTIAGFVVTCIGDSKQFSFIESKEKGTAKVGYVGESGTKFDYVVLG